MYIGMASDWAVERTGVCLGYSEHLWGFDVKCFTLLYINTGCGSILVSTSTMLCNSYPIIIQKSLKYIISCSWMSSQSRTTYKRYVFLKYVNDVYKHRHISMEIEILFEKTMKKINWHWFYIYHLSTFKSIFFIIKTNKVLDIYVFILSWFN